MRAILNYNPKHIQLMKNLHGISPLQALDMIQIEVKKKLGQLLKTTLAGCEGDGELGLHQGLVTSKRLWTFQCSHSKCMVP